MDEESDNHSEELNEQENSLGESEANGEDLSDYEVLDDDDNEGEILPPISKEELLKFQAAQEKAGLIYISRIPPGMRPSKVRYLMSGYGEIGKVYLQQEDPKRAYLRRKYTATKKARFTEGWVEFKDKKIARAVAEMLNAQPIGGKKGSRWRDDVWTMKYLPRFKWNMLTEHIAHESAVHREKLRVELAQSRQEQNDYLRQVELARVLDKRAKRKKEKAQNDDERSAADGPSQRKPRDTTDPVLEMRKRKRTDDGGESRKARPGPQIDDVLGSIF